MRDTPNEPLTGHRIQILMRVLATSGTLAGLCLTGLGVLHSFSKSESVSRAADLILATDSVIFIAATISCFLALRFRHLDWVPSLANWVELLFLAGLLGMLPFGAVILYTII